MRELKADHPALKGTTIFLKQVKEPSSVTRLLQPSSSNGKLSKGQKVISKGKWKGMPLYSLSLEERKTCPSTCQQWKTCYGNNMPFANRIDSSDSVQLFARLTEEVKTLSAKHTQGFVIRLHVLGDFYSVPYVTFWRRMLKHYTTLRIFGYTHREKNSRIGLAISRLNEAGAWIRWSDAGGIMSANVDGEGITCPEQTGKTASCMTCGLCWSTPKAINFLGH